MANIANQAVGTAQIENAAVTQAQIANGAVGSTQIASGGVATSNIALDAITTALIAPGAVANSNLSSSAVAANVMAPTFYSVNQSVVMNFSGPWGTPQGTTLDYQLFGNTVVLQINSVSSTASNNVIATSTTTLPTAITPSRSALGIAFVQNGSASAYGAVNVSSSGTITVGVGSSLSAFTGSLTAGWSVITIVYVLA
jgi:hypothetical protein